jgi:steroid 5-alpha reductase family enzyme
LVLVALWAARLTVYIARRNRGAPEDRRYASMRAAHGPGFWWKSLYLVFGLQAILAWVISLPLLAAILGVRSLGWLDYLALALWLVGLAFEALADRQLAEFKSRPENAGQVMDRGLWRYTRHPNYFGEACMWWGLYLFALAAGGWWSLPAPILMTWLLLRVSGVRLLEQDIGERRPGYRDYVRRTNAFIPGPPRSAAGPSTSGETHA